MRQFAPPYPGFSWSITQHVGPAAQPHVIYALLDAAHSYAGDPRYADRIADYLAAGGFLTPNVRGDARKPQPWRDYQQILPELGLIVSTRFTETITVTPAGLMWLDGLIGYSELITTQALRYQYPNGHKQDLSPTVRRALQSAGMPIPRTRTELDASRGVLVRPGVLVLRVLLELRADGSSDPTLSTGDCLACLCPLRRNADWPGAVSALLSRRSAPPLHPDARSLRHVQEWFRLLALTDIFNVSEGQIRLTPLAIQHAERLLRLCEHHEDPATFWTPVTGDQHEMARSWFNFYGDPELEGQWVLPEAMQDPAYVLANYPAGIECSEGFEEPETLRERTFEIRLRPLGISIGPADHPPRLGFTPQDELGVLLGRALAHRRTRLHDDIVNLVATKLSGSGYGLSEDPLSVDLLASRADGEAIIEVKTVTARNLPARIRLGLGQLSEYRFRRQAQAARRPTALLVLSSTLEFPLWLTDYLETDIRVGLVTRTRSDGLRAHTSGPLETILSE